MTETMNFTQEWDKTFELSEEVEHKKVTFTNHFGITLVADLYQPKGVTGKLPALAVSGPFGAVKEQASGLYAQEMAKRGYLTIAFDPSYTGESGGYPRYINSPDVNTEDYQAAVDYLATHDQVAQFSADYRNPVFLPVSYGRQRIRCTCCFCDGQTSA